MRKLTVNCDIGERGVNHPVDTKLFEFIDIANIACGGHSGNQKSITFYLELCKQYSVIPCLHISYPDKENFGRKKMNTSWQELEQSLNRQREAIPNCKLLKFHGELYHETCHNPKMTDKIITWFKKNKIEEIIVLSGCYLSQQLPKSIKAIPEFFPERCYAFDNDTLQLMSRKYKEACIESLDEAKEQVRLFIEKGEVKAKHSNHWRTFPAKAKTLSIHSDSSIALKLARFIRFYLQ